MGNRKKQVAILLVLGMSLGLLGVVSQQVKASSQHVAAEPAEQEEGEASAMPEEGTDPVDLNPGAADMRIGVMSDEGFLRSTGKYAQVYYAAEWSGENLNTGDTVLRRGQAVYCIEPKVPLIGEAGNQVSGEVGSKELLKELTTDRIPEKGVIFKMLGQVLAVCGMPEGTGPEICKKAVLGTQYLAAQLIIWQIVYGDMNEKFQLKGENWKQEAFESMRYWNQAPVGGRSVKSWYDEWIGLLQKINTLPSFVSSDNTMPPLSMDSEKLVLTDSNSVLAHTRLTASEESVVLKVSGDQLTIENPQHMAFTLTAENTIGEGAKQPSPIIAYDTTASGGYEDKRQTTIVVSTTALGTTVEGRRAVEPLTTTVEFHKQDKESHKQLAGAVLQICTAAGELLEEWTSGVEPHVIVGLAPGMYVLREKEAPRGYVTAGDIRFEVRRTQEKQQVTMWDDVTKRKISKKEVTGGQELPGAVLQIIDQDGNVVAEWTTGDTPHYIEKLPVGEYTLHEVTPPGGYVTAPDIPFTVTDSGEIQQVEMVDDVTKVEIRKIDMVTGEDLPGARLKILNEKGEVVAEWTTGDAPHYIEKLPVGNYVLQEAGAPEGYARAKEVSFSVEDTGEIQKVEMSDSVTKVQIHKTDLTTGEALPGAVLQIVDEGGTVVEEWTTGEKPYDIEKLPVGSYVLHEAEAPAGYVTAEDVSFIVEDTDRVQMVEMQDDITRVQISKLDVQGSKKLAGAQLQIRDLQGRIIKEWVSTGKAQSFEKLPVGKYVLHEVAAPEGYEVAADIQFEVKDSGEVLEVAMIDKEKTQTQGVRTGDAMQGAGYALLGLAALTGLLAAGLAIKRSHGKEKNKA